jgi:hypothetical protein
MMSKARRGPRKPAWKLTSCFTRVVACLRQAQDLADRLYLPEIHRRPIRTEEREWVTRTLREDVMKVYSDVQTIKRTILKHFIQAPGPDWEDEEIAIEEKPEAKDATEDPK